MLENELAEKQAAILHLQRQQGTAEQEVGIIRRKSYAELSAVTSEHESRVRSERAEFTGKLREERNRTRALQTEIASIKRSAAKRAEEAKAMSGQVQYNIHYAHYTRVRR
jgi:hypothetical protein